MHSIIGFSPGSMTQTAVTSSWGQSGKHSPHSMIVPLWLSTEKEVQAALVICGLFICDFAYMESRNGLFSGTYPLIDSNLWSFYMQIHYIWAYFWSPCLSHITRTTCIGKREEGFTSNSGISNSWWHSIPNNQGHLKNCGGPRLISL